MHVNGYLSIIMSKGGSSRYGCCSRWCMSCFISLNLTGRTWHRHCAPAEHAEMRNTEQQVIFLFTLLCTRLVEDSPPRCPPLQVRQAHNSHRERTKSASSSRSARRCLRP